MRKSVQFGHSRFALHLCAATALAALVSGCSTDASRWGDPFGNPFSTASDETAPAAKPRHVASNDVIPAGRTPPVTSQALAPRAVATSNAYRPSSMASNEPVSRETTGSIEPGPKRVASGTSFGGWTTTGGTPIEVAQGESADVIANRYGVPTKALLQVNGLANAAEVQPGTRITVPVYSATASSAHSAPMATSRTEERHLASAEPAQVLRAPSSARPAPARVVAQTTPKTLGTRSNPRQIATARTETAGTLTTPPGKHLIATTTTVATTKTTGPKIVTAKLENTKTVAEAGVSPVARTTVKTTTVVSMKPEKVAIAEAPKAAPESVPAASAPAPQTAAAGRIIQSFKGGSGGNDGINIAVPEGTSVKAAEGGVVAYAGSELKGYGNLVLIKHPNGFVSAYANNGEIDVKRGETVKRGQQIAKSGQSGNVSSPQLHFELRKGSTPVDPTQYLAGL